MSVASFGQFGLGKVGLGQKNSNTPDVGQVLTQSTDLVKLITASTDQGVLAMDELATAFPQRRLLLMENSPRNTTNRKPPGKMEH